MARLVAGDLSRLAAGKTDPFGEAPRLPARRWRSGGALRKGHSRPWPFCNAPYARVLRARIASICAAFRTSTRNALMALIDAIRRALAVVLYVSAAKFLICLGTVWLPLCIHVIN